MDICSYSGTEVKPVVISEEEPEVISEEEPEVIPEEEPEVISEEVIIVEPGEEPNAEPGNDSKEDGSTNDASNQYIPYVWFFVSILSSFPNPINFRWNDVLFNPLRF